MDSGSALRRQIRHLVLRIDLEKRGKVLPSCLRANVHLKARTNTMLNFKLSFFPSLNKLAIAEVGA